MRTSLKFSIAALSLAVGITACRDASANSAADNDELKRDLELASSATINLAAPKVDPNLLTLEGQPKSAPQTSKVVRKSPGNRVVHSSTPTVRAEPEVEVASVAESESAVTVEEAPAPESSEPVAVAPRPAPAGDYGAGGGIFGGGTSGGSVIRGTGGIDGDNCDLHRRGRGGSSGPVFRIPAVPTTGGSVIQRPAGGMIGGMGGARRVGSTVSRVSQGSSGMQRVSRPTFGGRGR